MPHQIGAGGSENLAIQQFAKQIAMAEAGLASSEVLHGNLATQRDMSDIKDSAPLIVALAERGVPGEAYNVGSGVQMSIQDLLDMAIAQARVPITSRLDPARLRAYDEKVLLADISKLRSLLGGGSNLTVAPCKADMYETVNSILNFWRRRVAEDGDVGVQHPPHANNTVACAGNCTRATDMQHNTTAGCSRCVDPAL